MKWFARTLASLSLLAVVHPYPGWSATNSPSFEEGEALGQYLLDYFSDFDQSIASPATGQSEMSTLDGTTSFNVVLTPTNSKMFLQIMVQQSPTGDIASGGLSVFQDTDFDGTIDYNYSNNFPISGICQNGVVSCTPATWNNCTYRVWKTFGSKATLQSAAFGDLQGCYCVNNYCGSQLIMNNWDYVLKYIGTGVVSAIQEETPAIGVANIVVQPPLIKFYGARYGTSSDQPDSFTGMYGLAPSELSQYYNNGSPNVAQMTDDAMSFSASQLEDTSSPYTSLINSATTTSTGTVFKPCTVRRNFGMTEVGPPGIFLVSGGPFLQVEYMIDTGLNQPYAKLSWGKIGWNYLSSNTYYPLDLQILRPDLISRLTYYYTVYDDYSRFDFKKSGTTLYTSPTFPRADGYSYLTPSTELRSMVTTPGVYTINPYVIIDASGGCLYSEALVYYNPECTLEESVIDLCAEIAADSNCQLKDESVDGVSTIRSYASTGLIPQPSAQSVSGVWCPAQDVEREWWQKDRVYTCVNSNPTFNYDDVMERTGSAIQSAFDGRDSGAGTYVDKFIDPATGAWSTATHDLEVNAGPTDVTTCVMTCKTRAPVAYTGANLNGTVGDQVSDTTAWEFHYFECTDGGTVCPAPAGEELLKDCQCINDFAESASVLEGLDAARRDMICSDGVKK